jgi:GntR family transcriptional regulator, galactonate operon transcriptional repressor
MNDRPTPSPIRFGGTRKRNLFAQVVEELGTLIVGGRIGPDDAFPKEAILESQFGVSRSVIREAVKTLAAKGLIESRTRTGIRVLPPVNWNLLDPEVLSWRYGAMPPERFFAELFEVRVMIEPDAAALAATRARGDDIAEMEQAFSAMTAASRADTPGIEADLRFHRAILAACRNPLLLQMGALINVGLMISHRFSREAFAIFLPKHRSVLDAIRAGDAGAAETAMRTLLVETRDYMKDHIRDP